jgi:hypothetical protein
MTRRLATQAFFGEALDDDHDIVCRESIHAEKAPSSVRVFGYEDRCQ